MASLLFEQFIAFGTDNVGLERLFRLLQSLSLLLLFHPLLFSLLLRALALHPTTHARAVQTTLIQLRTRFNLTRRLLRLFRFLDSFHQGYVLWVAAPGEPKSLEAWLDIAHRSLMGMYGLLETATLPDLLEVQGVALWGGEMTRTLNVEAQRFWFLALSCAVASGVLKLVKVFAYAPVPQAGSGYGTGEEGTGIKAAAAGTKDEKAAAAEADFGDWQVERERLRAIITRRKEERAAWRREVATKSRSLMRRLAADGLDLLLPGSVVGWVNVSQGTVGLAMLASTLITSLEVWEKCGNQVRARRAQTTR